MNISCPLPHLVVKTHPKQAKSAENLQVASLLLFLPTFLLSGNFGVGGVTSEPKERKMDLALSPSSSLRWPGGLTCGMTVAAVGFAAASALVNVLLPWLEEEDEEEEEEEEDPKRLTAAKEVPNLAPSPYCVKINLMQLCIQKYRASHLLVDWVWFSLIFCVPLSAQFCLELLLEIRHRHRRFLEVFCWQGRFCSLLLPEPIQGPTKLPRQKSVEILYR